MYKLVYYKAVNLIGFKSGMGRKIVEIDLSDFYDLDILLVIGDNGTGKSTFLSTVHPSHTPTNGKTKFIIPGKEGMLVRKYRGEDGTEMVSKCIYKPKKDGHTASCYLEMTRPDGDPIELNPSGNVTSYQDLLYTYFGITKEFLTFASYSNEVASIVRMTDTERKDSVGTLVPNTKRFATAFNIVNEKYKELRNLTRNVSQQILQLRDEDSLESDLKRLTSELKGLTEDREDHIRKLSKMEGRLKELTKGSDIDEMMNRYNILVASLASYNTRVDKTYAKLMKLYDRLGIEPEKEGSIQFKTIDQVPSFIMKYERKLASCNSALSGYGTQMERLISDLNKVRKEMLETQSALDSIETEDINELKNALKSCHMKLESLRYTRLKDRCEGMSYDEITNFTRVVAMMDQMIQGLYDEYGHMVSEFFASDNRDEYIRKCRTDVSNMRASVQTTSAKKDQIYRKLIEKQQYVHLQEVLRQRPKTCTIDSCPFIAQALKYQNVAYEISELQKQYSAVCIQLDSDEATAMDMERKILIQEDANRLIQYVEAYQGLFKKYCNISLEDLYRAIANGTWRDLVDIMKLKDIAAILSEKDLYIKITTQNIPQIEHSIELAKAYGSNRDLLEAQLKRLQDQYKSLIDSQNEISMHLNIHNTQLDRYQSKLEAWKEVSDAIQEYRETITAQLEAHEKADEQSQQIDKIKDLVRKCKETKALIKELDEAIRQRTPMREKVKLDLDALRRLKIQKLQIEQEFTVIEILKLMVSPGKGIRKELIDLYMYEIYQIANELLLNTFDGKLYLQEFLITDKEFIIPYVYNSNISPDISFASSAQQAAISSAISLAILSKLVDKYGIYTPDELDNSFNPKNKGNYINVLVSQMRYVGITQAIIITQEIQYYEGANAGVICFPGGEVSGNTLEVLEV